jgi:hypothetical protein
MSYDNLQERKHYEDRYDNGTIAKCRSGESIVNGTFTEMEKRLPKKELTEKLTGLVSPVQSALFSICRNASSCTSRES